MARFCARTLSVDDIPMLMTLDEEVFPSEMLLTREDYEHLVSIPGGILIEAKEDEHTIGAAFALPAEAMKDEIQNENDPAFEVRPHELYSYSVAVAAASKGQGLGSSLARRLADEAKLQGWKFLSAHVRMRAGWAEKRKTLLSPVATRIISGYWDDPRELMEYQLVDLTTLTLTEP